LQVHAVSIRTGTSFRTRLLCHRQSCPKPRETTSLMPSSEPAPSAIPEITGWRRNWRQLADRNLNRSPPVKRRISRCRSLQKRAWGLRNIRKIQNASPTNIRRIVRSAQILSLQLDSNTAQYPLYG
jgi:hypothetical protein